jgi:hypothetical protein
VKSSAELRAKPFGNVFPPPDVVENIFSGRGENAEQTEQFWQKDGKTRI